MEEPTAGYSYERAGAGQGASTWAESGGSTRSHRKGEFQGGGDKTRRGGATGYQ